MTFILGLTGSMATGKSTVLSLFTQNHIPTYSADAAVHDLYRGEAVPQLQPIFPNAIVDGQIDRQKLSAALMSAPEKLKTLEDIVHPLVRQKSQNFIDRARADNTLLVLLEIPLLFETKSTYPIDGIAVTWCNDDIQRQRALARDGMNVEKLERLLARQMPQADKKQRANFLIDTGKSLAETESDIKIIIAACLSGDIPKIGSHI